MPKKKEDRGILEGQARYCGGCGKKIHASAKSCPHCGYTLVTSEVTTTKTRAIIGLLLNVLIWPGLGTIVGGETGKGVAQIILFLIGIPLMFVIIGIPLVIGVWIWALVSSINQLNRAE